MEFYFIIASIIGIVFVVLELIRTIRKQKNIERQNALYYFDMKIKVGDILKKHYRDAQKIVVEADNSAANTTEMCSKLIKLLDKAHLKAYMDILDTLDNYEIALKPNNRFLQQIKTMGKQDKENMLNKTLENLQQIRIRGKQNE